MISRLGGSPTKIKIYSFDVFDTCLCRPVVEPSDIFWELARRVLSVQRFDVSEDTMTRLYLMRLRGEKIARKRLIYGQDLKLVEIYQAISDINELDIDIDCMMKLEIEVEMESVVPVLELQRQVEACRHKGKVVFASDMYLPEHVVASMLAAHGFMKEADTLYVSCEVGLNKYSSQLYHHIAAREGVNTAEILHVGDDRKSDVRRAELAGVRTSVFRGIRLNRYEKNAAREQSCREGKAVVGLLRSMRLRLSRGTPGPAGVASEQLLYSVIAPFLTAYVSWVLDMAQRRGITRLYFVSRDGQILHRIAGVLAPAFGDIECRYIFGSRNAWFAPSIVQCDSSDLYWAYMHGMIRTPEAILRRIGLEWDQLAREFPSLSVFTRTEELAGARLTQFIERLQSTGIRQRILDHAAALRRATLSYFEQEGLLADTNWSFVDVGWELNAQAAVSRILAHAGVKNRPDGFYLGIFKRHVPTRYAGDYSAYFAQTGSEIQGRHAGDWIFDNQTRVLLEHIFLVADHPTVTSYRYCEKWEPVFGVENPDERLSRYVTALHTGVEDYARALLYSGVLAEEPSRFMQVANELLASFLADPDRDDVKCVAWIPTNIEQTHDRTYEKRVASPMSLGEIAQMVLYELRSSSGRYSNARHAWYTGSAALSLRFNRLVFQLLRRMRRLIS